MKWTLTATFALAIAMATATNGNAMKAPALSQRDIALAQEAFASPLASRAQCLIVVDSASQRLVLWRNRMAERVFTVSTAIAGIGCAENSGKTPSGWHRACEWIGDGAPMGQVFVSRIASGEILTPVEWSSDSGEDRVLFDFLREEIDRVNKASGSLAELPLRFLLRLCKVMGYFPEDNYASPSRYFSLQECRFQPYYVEDAGIMNGGALPNLSFAVR